MAVLALLMAGTSWAVASWVSEWLVPPYLILMALLLSPSSGRQEGEPASERSEASKSPHSARPGEELDDPDPDPEALASPEAPDDGSDQAAAKAPKGRRGKGRVKKAKPLPEPTEANWVEVAPGKFVRVEASDESSGQAGPHARVGIPVEVPATPQRLEFEEGDLFDRPESPPERIDPLEGPIEDAGTAGFDLVEARPEDDPTGDVESGSMTDWGSGEMAGSSGTLEDTSAADGNAPQAGRFFAKSETGTPDAPPEAIDDRTWIEQGEGWEDEDDSSFSTEDPERTSSQALADVRPEDADERGATLERTDPTETPVDETDLDDAGPFELTPLETGTSTDADPPATEAQPGRSIGPPRWPWRLAPRARTRVGPPPRATDRCEAPPGRPVRSHGPARRPPDPRRLGRRGLARPRQVNRTFPPRSPPSGRVGRGQASCPATPSFG